VSPWLSLGVLSPRGLFHALERASQHAKGSGEAAQGAPLGPQPWERRERVGSRGASLGLSPARARSAPAPPRRPRPVPPAPQGASWLLHELLYRDFFQLLNLKMASGHGAKPSTQPAMAF
jgi:deoxyribodipyrimidine photolyase